MKDLSPQAVCVGGACIRVCAMFENRFHVSLVDLEFAIQE